MKTVDQGRAKSITVLFATDLLTSLRMPIATNVELQVLRFFAIGLLQVVVMPVRTHRDMEPIKQMYMVARGLMHPCLNYIVGRGG